GKVVEGKSDASLIADLPADRQALLQAADGLLEASETPVHLTDVAHEAALPVEVADVLADLQSLFEENHGTIRAPGSRIPVPVDAVQAVNRLRCKRPVRKLLELVQAKFREGAEVHGASLSPWVSDFGTDRHGLLQVVDCLLEFSELPVNTTQTREHPRLGLKVPSAPCGGKAKGVDIPSESKVSSEVKEAPHGIGQLPGNWMNVSFGGLLGGCHEIRELCFEPVEELQLLIRKDRFGSYR